MELTFSRALGAMQPSAIREILKVAADPAFLSFSAGNPSADTFPVAELEALSRSLWKEQAKEMLQYGVTEGYRPLIDWTNEWLQKRYGIGRDGDETIVVSGGQQAIELCATALLNEGDVVLCEDPSFIGALNAFRSLGARVVGCEMDEGGMKMDVLEQRLRENPNAKIIYTIPTFQNPTSRTMPFERRKRLLSLAEAYGVLILEDSPYIDLRTRGDDVPTLKSMDARGQVLFAGSYSKILAPGMRVGYAVGPAALTAKMTVAKQVSDVHTTTYFQMLAHAFLERHDLDTHIAGLRRLYREKQEAMRSAIDRWFDPRISVTDAEGGLYFWCELPAGCDSVDLASRLIQRKVAIVPGSAFAVTEGGVSPAFRLNFSLPTIGQIEQGMKIIGEEIAHMLREENQ